MAKLILFSILCLSTIQIIDAARRRRPEDHISGEEQQQTNIALLQDEGVSMLNANAIDRACNALIPAYFMFIEKSDIVATLLASKKTHAALAHSLHTTIDSYENAISGNCTLAERWHQFRETFADYVYGTNFELALLMRMLGEKPYSDTYYKLTAGYTTEAESLNTN